MKLAHLTAHCEALERGMEEEQRAYDSAEKTVSELRVQARAGEARGHARTRPCGLISLHAYRISLAGILVLVTMNREHDVHV